MQFFSQPTNHRILQVLLAGHNSMKPSGAKAMVIGAVVLTVNQMSLIEAMVSFGFWLREHATMKVSQSPPHSVGLVTYVMSYLL